MEQKYYANQIFTRISDGSCCKIISLGFIPKKSQWLYDCEYISEDKKGLIRRYYQERLEQEFILIKENPSLVSNRKE